MSRNEKINKLVDIRIAAWGIELLNLKTWWMTTNWQWNGNHPPSRFDSSYTTATN